MAHATLWISGGKLKTLISDLGNVLLFFSHERMCQQLATLSGLSLAAIKKMLFEERLGEQLEYGTLSSAGLHKLICAKSGNSIDFNEMLLAAADIFQVNEEMIPFLTTLKNQGKRLVLLSNTCEAHFTFAKERFPFLKLFDAYILSYELATRKPEEKIFRAALDAAGCAPEECLYIDDIPEYVEAATRLKIPSHTFKNLRELIDAQKHKEKSFLQIST